jgi:hypothetical protein
VCKPVRIDLSHGPRGIAADALPQVGVHRLEEVAGLRVPTPAQVRCDPVEGDEPGRQGGADRESADGLHD